MRKTLFVFLMAVLLAGCCCPTQEGCFFTGHSMCPKCWVSHQYPCR